LGVKVKRVWRFRVVDGRIIERRIVDALVECMEEQAPTVVVFAEEGDGKVFGFMRLRD